MVCLIAGYANALVSFVFFYLTLHGHTSLPLYFSAVGLLAIVYALGVPAQRSILASVVSGDRYVRASAIVSSVAQVVGIVGPAIAGVLIAINVPLAFGFATALHLIGGTAFVFMKPRPPEKPEEGAADLWRSAMDGLHFIFNKKIILGAISLDLFAVLFGGATALLPIYATQILHVGATGFGWLRAAPGIGAALVALWIARYPIERHAGRWLIWCVAGFGAFTIVFGLSRSMPLTLLSLALVGGFDMVSMVIRGALTQLNVPDAMRGRIGAVENIFIGASNELGTFESGVAAAWLGAVPAVALGGVATLIVIAIWTRIFPDLARYDRLSGPSA